MTRYNTDLNWSTDIFVDCYNSIKYQDQLNLNLISNLRNDLFHILNIPSKSDISRNKLIDESNPVKFSNGDEFRLNKEFIESSIYLSTELNIDEVLTAELLYNSTKLSYEKGTTFIDSGRLAYFTRLQLILNILGYLISSKNLHLVVYENYDEFFSNLLLSFQNVYEMLEKINDLIDKQKVTDDINNLSFINTINYIKSQLFNCHEVLGQIYFSLVDTYFERFGTLKYYGEIVDHISKTIHDNDILIVHYLPGLLRFITNLHEMPDVEVFQFHKQIVTRLSSEYDKVVSDESVDLSKSNLKGFEMVLNFMMLTCFIPWCKLSESRTNSIDFKDDILRYIEMYISCGVTEVLLCYAADTSNYKTTELLDWSNLYDFRSLLQTNFPRLSPAKFIYTNSDDLTNLVNLRPQEFENVNKLLDVSNYKVSEDFNQNLLAPFFHIFFNNFISNAAIILTLLRDNEEDFLLSSINKKQLENDEKISKGDEAIENDKDGDRHDTKKFSPTKSNGNDQGIDLDEIATRSDLERFYLAFVYTYNNRQELCSLFWSNEEITNDIIGFVTWGLSNNTSPLISATFCLLLGSLTSSGDEAAIKIWEILVNNNGSATNASGTLKKDFSKISIDSIIDSLNYYIESLNENFEQDLNYQAKLQQKRQEFLFSSSFNNTDNTNESDNYPLNKVLIELSEDSVVFISGFMQLISSIVGNLSSTNERSKEIKNIAFTRFSPIIRSFLKFDNIITVTRSIQSSNNSFTVSNGSNNSKTTDSLNVLVNDDNRVILVNLLLNLLTDFVKNEENLAIRYKVWNIIDRWISQSMNEGDSSKANNSKYSGGNFINLSNSLNGISNNIQSQSRLKYPNKRTVTMRQGFQFCLTRLSLVGNFTKLVSHLLRPLETESQKAFTAYKLLYPADLGAGYRYNNQIGIWPYVEYLLLEVFSKSDDLPNKNDQYNLQLSLVSLIESSLSEIDWVFLNDVAPNIINNLKNLDNIVDSLSPSNPITYQLFIKLHHTLAVLNYLFDEKVYKSLFNIISIGTESINENEGLSILVDKCLTILDKVLEVQDTFIHRLLPILKSEKIQSFSGSSSAGFGTSMSLALSAPKSVYDNIYYPKSIGTNGISDFYEIFLFNLASIAHFALYVSSPQLSIANSAIKILHKISLSPFFIARVEHNSADPLLNKNRLLTVFESIDESVKIQFSFIQQIERYIEDYDDLQVKFSILQFLIDNLQQSIGEPGVSHFLLGYEIRGGNLFLNDSRSKNTLLKSLLKSLSSSLDLISEIDYNNGNIHIIDAAPAELSSKILEIFVKLCHDPISSNITLNYLRNYNLESNDLFAKLIDCQPKIDPNTIWSNVKFQGDLQDGKMNSFIQDSLAPRALLSFINHRNLILQYLSLEFLNISQQRAIIKKDSYIDLLLNGNEFLNGSPKILNFLDVLNFKFFNFEIHKYELFNGKYNLPLILEQMTKNKLLTHVLDTSVLENLYKIICKNANGQLQNKESKISFSQEVMDEGSKITEFLTKYIISIELKNVQLSCLHSWTQLIQVLVSDGDMSLTRKSNLILEIFQIILPKINDYLGQDISFSEEFISLCVLLFDLYEQESSSVTQENDKVSLYIDRLIPLFKTCINGIMSSNSTPDLRSDLYVLVNKFLQKSFKNNDLIKQIIMIIKLVDSKFIDIISNDSICAEGAPRITSLLLLESLIHLSSSNKVNFILELMIKNNSLSLLVRSIKRTDEMLSHYSDSSSLKNGIDTLLYELTAFKSTLYFLIRIAQTRLGSSQLIQNEIFSIIKQCKFLSIDPDLGLDLKINELSGNSKSIYISLSLDTPISLIDVNKHHTLEKDNKISFFEFLVPIFQLISAVLLSMGPSYKPSIIQAKDLLHHFDRLVVGVMKRDVLIENTQIQSQKYQEDSISYVGLKDLVQLIVLLDSLVNYESNDKN